MLLFDLSTGATAPLIDGISASDPFGWSPDGSRLLYQTTDADETLLINMITFSPDFTPENASIETVARDPLGSPIRASWIGQDEILLTHRTMSTLRRHFFVLNVANSSPGSLSLTPLPCMYQYTVYPLR
jgi:hypothetical protein